MYSYGTAVANLLVHTVLFEHRHTVAAAWVGAQGTPAARPPKKGQENETSRAEARKNGGNNEKEGKKWRCNGSPGHR